MKKNLIYLAAGVMMIAASCKEHVAPPSANLDATDTTYVDVVAPATPKRILVEELSGVKCPNCPQGSDTLEGLSTQYPLNIVTIHSGSLTNPIEGISTQNFQTADGLALINSVWHEEAGKPCAAFDRLTIGNLGSKYFVSGFNSWRNSLVQATAAHTTSPVNIDVQSKYHSETDVYDITVTVKYTATVTGVHSLNIFLTENNIVNAQEYSQSNIDTFHVFNHVLRKAITAAATGKTILTSLGTDTKEAGRVYSITTHLKIDKTDPGQKLWNQDNMVITAFLSNVAPDDIHVIQVAETKLKN